MHKPFELLFVNLVFTDDCLRTALVAGKLRIGNGLLTGWGRLHACTSSGFSRWFDRHPSYSTLDSARAPVHRRIRVELMGLLPLQIESCPEAQQVNSQQRNTIRRHPASGQAFLINHIIGPPRVAEELSPRRDLLVKRDILVPRPSPPGIIRCHATDAHSEKRLGIIIYFQSPFHGSMQF